MKSFDTDVIILAAGKGTRAGLGYNKMLFNLGELTVLQKTVGCFSDFKRIIIATSPDDRQQIESMFFDDARIIVTDGGETRSRSVRNALKHVSAEFVIIHDGARPYVNEKIILDSLISAKENGSGIAAVPSTNAVKILSDGKLTSVNRDKVFIVQTPQTFTSALIKSAYDKVSGDFADDSEVFEKAGFTPALSGGSLDNIKLTAPSDLYSGTTEYKIGIGYDVHQLVEGRRLILGGVDIPHYKGLLGHSDADVLCHAVTDAFLSAASLPDIGVLFPDNDDRFKDIDSFILLNKAIESAKDYKILSVSAVVAAQKPKLAPHIPTMRKRFASAFNSSIDNINISATTTEGLGIVGEESGMAAFSIITLCRR